MKVYVNVKFIENVLLENYSLNRARKKERKNERKQARKKERKLIPLLYWATSRVVRLALIIRDDDYEAKTLFVNHCDQPPKKDDVSGKTISGE
jgi:hypothetical protein